MCSWSRTNLRTSQNLLARRRTSGYTSDEISIYLEPILKLSVVAVERFLAKLPSMGEGAIVFLHGLSPYPDLYRKYRYAILKAEAKKKMQSLSKEEGADADSDSSDGDDDDDDDDDDDEDEAY